MQNQLKINSMIAPLEVSDSPGDYFHSRESRRYAQDAVKKCKERDKGKVQIPHPKLPNTWLLVSPEKAKKMLKAE